MLPLISVHSYERIGLVVESVLERDHHALESHPLPRSLPIFDLGSWFRADVRCHLRHVQVVQGSIHLVQHEEGRRPEAARRRTTTTRSRWPNIRNLVASKNLYNVTTKLWTEESNQVNRGEERKHHFIRHQNKRFPSKLSHRKIWIIVLIRCLNLSGLWLSLDLRMNINKTYVLREIGSVLKICYLIQVSH